MPRGYDAVRAILAADDPAALSDLALEKRFTAGVAAREIEDALAAGDTELAQSFVALAAERDVPVAQSLRDKVSAAEREAASAMRRVRSFARGFVIGDPDDVASLVGTAAGDLLVIGDVRDTIREGLRLARGDQADPVILGLAGAGLAITAGTYASLGAAAPARAGLTLVKVARRSGRIGEPLLRAVRLEKAEGLVRLAGDLGRMQTKAGTRAALDGLKIAQHPRDVAKLAQLAVAKGGKTRAILKMLGRGAIVLGGAIANLALWALSALVNLIWLAAACKRSVERATLRYLARRRARRLAMRLQGLAASGAAG